MTATTATPKFTVETEDGEVYTYSRKIAAVARFDALADEGIAARLTRPNGEVIEDTIESDEDEDAEGNECGECGEAQEDTAFPTVSVKGGGRARDYRECRTCRNERLASGGHKIARACTVACRQSTGTHDEKKCQCLCGGYGHGSEAVQQPVDAPLAA